jgi:GNAT superfamily N-acetyltransferase
MNKTVRRADEADAELISLLNADVQSLHAAAMPAIFKKPGPETFPPTQARMLLINPSNLIFVAEVDSEPAGYAYAELIHQSESPFRYAWDEVHLHHISVRREHRRKGMATALLEAIRRSAHELGIKRVTLQAWSFNEEAQAFFRQQGFTPYIVRFWNEPIV